MISSPCVRDGGRGCYATCVLGLAEYDNLAKGVQISFCEIMDQAKVREACMVDQKCLTPHRHLCHSHTEGPGGGGSRSVQQRRARSCLIIEHTRYYGRMSELTIKSNVSTRSR
jgi:hypothetical protein